MDQQKLTKYKPKHPSFHDKCRKIIGKKWQMLGSNLVIGNYIVLHKEKLMELKHWIEGNLSKV
jgi:hypothetical protein